MSVNRHYLLVILIIGLFLTVLWLFLGRVTIFETSVYNRLYGLSEGDLYRNNVFWLASGTDIKQEFVPRYPGLYKVAIFLVPWPQLDKDVSLVLQLKDECSSPDSIRQLTTTVSRDDLNDSEFMAFEFEPLENSVGRQICLVLAADTAQDDWLLGVKASTVDVYSDGKARYTEFEPPPQPIRSSLEAAFSIFLPIVSRTVISQNVDIGLELYYADHPLPIAQALLTHIAANKPYFFGNQLFYLSLLFSYVVSVTWLIRLMIRR